MTRVERFTADDVALDPRVGFIGFADNANRRYFWMQPDEVSTAKECIWLERDDQQWGGTGKQWTITLRRSAIVVDTHHLPWMACDSIEIEYAIDDDRYGQLKRLMQQVMASCPGDLRVADEGDARLAGGVSS